MPDAYATEYTEEEIEALPQTAQVFTPSPLHINDHDWRQEGYMITDVCSPSRPDCQYVGIPIPSGKLLVKRGGTYDLVDERSR